MDPITRLLMQGAAGAAGEKVYIEDVFSTWLYTGNGSTQTITNGIDLSGEGGLVWTKERIGPNNHLLYDTNRGTGKYVSSNTSTAEITNATTLTSFNSDGFSLGVNASYNGNGTTYASWTFRKAPKFFDVVTYTGTGSATTMSHSLGSVPGCMIVKATNSSDYNWQVYHRGLGANFYIELNTTTQAVDESANTNKRWNATTPSATTFTLGNSPSVNANGTTYVAYLFAHDAGGFGDTGTDSVVSCGSFTTDASSNATVTLGWEPQWVLTKAASGAFVNNWRILDNMRGMGVQNSPQAILVPNDSSAEQIVSSGYWIPAVSSTGFTVQWDPNTTYIYIAIRRGPMRTPTDATEVFSMVDRAGTNAPATVTGFTHLIDTLIVQGKQNGYPANFFDRLRGATRHLDSANPYAEITNANTLTGFDVQTGYTVGSDNSGYGINYAPGGTYINWAFRRAPGFFDVVAYTGDSSKGRSIPHNLAVAPEMIIVKRRTASTQWTVYHAKGNNGTSPGNLYLDATNAATVGDLPYFWGNETILIAPTSSVFTVNAFGDYTNGSGSTYIAYLFASCPGVSKVGSYTGTGTTQQINCGFTAGARFVLIKRTDSTGDWYVWDSARGIIAGNDPYLLLNSTAAEVTSTDYVDTFSSGFEISSTAPAAINANGGSFIFLAIA